MFSLLVALLCVLPLARCDCNADKLVPGCKATCNDGSSDGQPTVLDISNTFQYPESVNGDGHTYTYACGGGLKCPDNTDNTTAVCQDGTDIMGQSTLYVVIWTLISTNPLTFSVEYGGGGGEGLSHSSLFIFTQVPGSGETTLVYNGTDVKVTFHVTGECFFTCNGASDGGKAGPIGFALIAFSILIFISYFIVGAIIMHFARGARGVEVIPNFSFWIGLPSLLKDGLLFVIHPCYKKGEYEKI